MYNAGSVVLGLRAYYRNLSHAPFFCDDRPVCTNRLTAALHAQTGVLESSNRSLPSTCTPGYPRVSLPTVPPSSSYHEIKRLFGCTLSPCGLNSRLPIRDTFSIYHQEAKAVDRVDDVFQGPAPRITRDWLVAPEVKVSDVKFRRYFPPWAQISNSIGEQVLVPLTRKEWSAVLSCGVVHGAL